MSATPAAPTSLAAAFAALGRGEPVLTVDDIDGTGTDMIVLARDVHMPVVAEMIRLGSGFLCVTIDPRRAEKLALPPMTWASAVRTFGGRMCVSVDALGTTTGISALDRTTTLRTIADPDATVTDFTRPGHVIPVLTDDAVIDRPGILARAGLRCGDDTTSPVAFVSLVSEIDPVRIAGTAEAGDRGLPVLRYSDLLATWT